jgi:hypothetical protein
MIRFCNGEKLDQRLKLCFLELQSQLFDEWFNEIVDGAGIRVRNVHNRGVDTLLQVG